MSMAESGNFTVQKALAQWKLKSGVMTIERSLDHAYRDITLIKLTATLEK